MRARSALGAGKAGGIPVSRLGMAAWKHLRAITVLPVTVTLVVPTAILHLAGGWPGWAGPGWLAAGAVLAAVGVTLLVSTNVFFARIGKGTLAPWDPTRRLVVRGPYRHVRNPMISGVMFLLLGESALVASAWLLAWFALFALLNAVFIPLWEERDLARRFGEEYKVYKSSVPRWIPRIRPWDPPGSEPGGTKTTGTE